MTDNKIEILIKQILKWDTNASDKFRAEIDDFIIERSDGSATYNLCVVVDDLDSNISHVIRGDDHVNNTFKQINIFKSHVNCYLYCKLCRGLIVEADLR